MLNSAALVSVVVLAMGTMVLAEKGGQIRPKMNGKRFCDRRQLVVQHAKILQAQGLREDALADPTLATKPQSQSTDELLGTETADDVSFNYTAMTSEDFPGSCQGLNLEYHSGVQRMRAEGAQALFAALQNWHGRIQVFSFVGQEIGDAGALALADYLGSDAGSHCREVVLMRNKITDVGVAAIAKAVAKHPRIEVLNLVRNEVGDAGALALGEALKENESLKELLLNYNKIGTAGIKAIGDALDGGNASLVRLMVAENEVEDKEVLRNTLRLARDLRDKSNYVAE